MFPPLPRPVNVRVPPGAVFFLVQPLGPVDLHRLRALSPEQKMGPVRLSRCFYQYATHVSRVHLAVRDIVNLRCEYAGLPDWCILGRTARLFPRAEAPICAKTLTCSIRRVEAFQQLHAPRPIERQAHIPRQAQHRKQDMSTFVTHASVEKKAQRAMGNRQARAHRFFRRSASSPTHRATRGSRP